MASFRRRNDARCRFIGTLLVRTKLILVVSSFVHGVDQFLKVPSHPRLHMDRDKGQRGRSSRMLFSIISYLSEREIPSLHLDVSADLSISNSLGIIQKMENIQIIKWNLVLRCFARQRLDPDEWIASIKGGSHQSAGVGGNHQRYCGRFCDLFHDCFWRASARSWAS
jgi:hypothetical protein